MSGDGYDGLRQMSQAVNQAINDTVGDPIRRYHALPEGVDKNRKRAVWGTGLLAGGGYVVRLVQVNTGDSPGDLVHFFIQGARAPVPTCLAFYGFAATMLFGLLWVVVGVRGSRGPRHVMMAFWALARIGLGGAALWYGLYANDSDIDPWLRGLYVVVLASGLMALFVALRGPGRGAVPLVQRHIVQQTRAFRIGRRRSF